jgi:tungstate transport system substrate-binding protein
MTSRLAVLLPLLLAVAACGRGGDGAPQRLRLATTTSTENSGLLAWLLGPFQAETGIQVQVIAVGTGQALALGERGDADLVLVHDRAREDRFVADGHATGRRDVMWNDFVLLGPPDDPAGTRTAGTITEALQRIDAAGATWVSRGDGSGTHAREQELRAAAGLPAGTPSATFLETGQGMGPSLTVADEKRAYLLADRGTWLAFRSRLDLAVLAEGDPTLRNPYGVLLLDPRRHPGLAHDAARRLADWLVGPLGQARIGAFQVGGEVLFHPAHVD